MKIRCNAKINLCLAVTGKRAGGLGGGSSDAAGVILGLDKLYDTKLFTNDTLYLF